MFELRSSMMAAALLCVAACADAPGEAAHRDCFRKAVEEAMETKIDRSIDKPDLAIEPTGRAAPPPVRGHAARKKAAVSTTPDSASGSACECEPEPLQWDGTGRAEAVRGT
jgi:hypothetical protein